MIIELSNFRIVSILLGILGILISSHYFIEGLLVEVIPLAIFSMIFVPFALYYFTSKTKRTEESPLLGGFLSLGVLVVLVIISYAISFFILGVISIQWSFLMVGVYGLLIKNDLRKIMVSLAICIYSLHLFTGAFDVLIEVVISMFSAILFLVLLYIAHWIFVLKSSLSTRDLKELRF